MSTLGNIARNALSAPREMLGADGQADTLSIASGNEWKVTRAETRTDRDYELGGQQVTVSLTVVGETESFEDVYQSQPKDYLGKLATVNGATYRVANISKGEVFTTIELVGEEEAA